MQAGGVFLAPTLQLLKQKGLLVPPDDPKHIFIVSNDGIPQEFEAIRKGEIDATVSQPADLYAKYALFYAKAAVEGKTFKPGPTDHDSTIIEVRNGMLEDQLPAPLVTKDNVDDAALWGNQIGQVMTDVRHAAGGRADPPRPSRRSASPSASARPSRSTTSASRSGPARRTRSSAATAPASRRWSRVLTGLHAPDEGTVRFGGEPAPAPSPTATAWRRQVACVYQRRRSSRR